MFTQRVVRRALSIALPVLLAFGAHAPAAHAQAAAGSDVPLRWIIGYPPGGGADFIVRTIGTQLAKELGRPVVIDNRPGGNTFIAVQAAARSAPDGNTILFADNGTLVLNKALFAKIPYDIATDFAPVTTIHRIPIILVANPAFPANSFQQMVDMAKARPKGVNYATPGQGTPHHIAMELLADRAGISLTDVPYKGAAPGIQDLLGNQVPMMAADPAFTLDLIKSGKLKGLVTMTSKRSPALPDLQSIGEAGIQNLELYAWAGVLVPKGTPPDVIARLNTALTAAINDPETSRKMRNLGIEPMPGPPEALAQRIEAEARIWQPMIRARGIQLN